MPSRAILAAAFNEWMRLSIEEPDKFRSQIEDVRDFIQAENAGVEPSYGYDCAVYLERLLASFID